MSSKKQSLQNKRAAKKQKRTKAKSKAANIARNTEKSLFGQATKSDVIKDVGTKGLIQTADDIRKEKGRAQQILNKEVVETITTKQVLETLNSTIPHLMSVSAGLEVTETIHKENNHNLPDDVKQVIIDFDKGCVRLAEDQDALFTLIESGQEPDEYMGFYVAHLNTLAEVMDISLPAVMDMVISPFGEEVDQFVTEHRQEGDTFTDLTQRYHEQRMLRIAPLYRTPVQQYEQAPKELPEETVAQNTPLTC